MDRGISKIWKVLNSVYHKEQAVDVEVSRKSANCSFAGIKELKVCAVPGSNPESHTSAKDASTAQQEQMNLASKTKRAMKILP